MFYYSVCHACLTTGGTLSTASCVQHQRVGSSAVVQHTGGGRRIQEQWQVCWLRAWNWLWLLCWPWNCSKLLRFCSANRDQCLKNCQYSLKLPTLFLLPEQWAQCLVRGRESVEQVDVEDGLGQVYHEQSHTFIILNQGHDVFTFQYSFYHLALLISSLEI